MPIVRSDKREEALTLVKEMRSNIEAVMRQGDALQAGLESLELALGLTTEGEQAQRSTYMVLHCPKGSENGHTLDECTDDCAAEEVLEDLGETGGDDESEESEAKPEG